MVIRHPATERLAEFLRESLDPPTRQSGKVAGD
jgi:hypothetical protein